MSRDYAVGDTVLALNGGQLYIAKVLKTRPVEGTSAIEYMGWKSRWDEWLPQDKVHEDNEESRILQAKLKAQATFEDKFSAREKEKRKDEDDDRITLRLNIPHILQKYLIDEGDRIGSNKAGSRLPIHPSVSEVLNEFLSLKGANNPLESCLLNDMIQGLTSYFDKALGMMLLYEEERAEYKEYRAQHAGQRMSDAYGTPHLLRLLVKLPLLLNQAKMSSEGIKALQPRIQELLRYLEVHSDRLLSFK